MPKHNPDADKASEYKPSFFKTMVNKTISGGFAGAVEVLVDHPWWTLKTRFQDSKIPKRQKLTFSPSVLYQGLRPNMLSMVPITALQVGSAEAIKAGMVLNSKDGTVTSTGALSANCMGGAFSALVGGPTELVMAHQTNNKGFVETAKSMVQQRGISCLKTGMGGTSVRDAIFTAGYLSGKPYLTQQFSPYMSDNKATVAGGVAAGAGAAILSQPFDALKTAQQTSLNSTERKSITPMWRMAMDVIRKEGVTGLYKGSIPRTIRVMSAIPLIGIAQQEADKWLTRKPK